MFSINWEKSIGPTRVDSSEWVKGSFTGCVALETENFGGFTFVLISAKFLLFLKIAVPLKDLLHFMMSFSLQE